MLADEPTGNLDPDLAREVMQLFREINASGTTVLVATHDRQLIRDVGHRAIVLEHGRVTAGGAMPPEGTAVMRSLGVHVREALGGLRRDWRSAVLSLLVVAASALATAVVLVASTCRRPCGRAPGRPGGPARCSWRSTLPPDARVRVEEALRREAAVAQVGVRLARGRGPAFPARVPRSRALARRRGASCRRPSTSG